MSHNSSSVSLINPNKIGTAIVSFPFWTRGDQETMIVKQEYYQAADHYRPPVLDSALSANDIALEDGGVFLNQNKIFNAICVGDSEPAPIGNGFVSFFREWSIVPKSRIQTESNYAYTYPGIDRTGVYNVFSSGDFTSSYEYKYTPLGVYVIAYTFDFDGTPHGFNVGDTVYFEQIFTYWWGSVTSARRVEEVPSSDRFVVYGYFVGYLLDVNFNTIKSEATSLSPENYQVTTLVQYEYFVTNDFTSIEILNPFKILDSDGNRTNSLSATTNPSISEWTQKTANKEYLIPQYSQISEWKGNIKERKTYFIPYLSL